MLSLSQYLSKIESKIYFYGGKKGVAEELSCIMEKRYPGMIMVGTYCPPFRELTIEEQDEIVEIINRAAPDVVWVGLSTPKQEKWMASFRPRLKAPVLIGVGAAFDYNTGRIKRAPAWMQISSLEWIYRLIQDPKRLSKRYFRANTLFVFHLLSECIRFRHFQR